MRKLSLVLFALCFVCVRVAAQPAPAPLADLDSYVQKIFEGMSRGTSRQRTSPGSPC